MAAMFVSTLTLLVLVNICSSTTSPFKCPETGGWMSKGRKCYKWGSSPKYFSDATAYCSQLGATIQLIEREEENNFFKETSSSEVYWLGLTMKNRRHGINQWRTQNNTNWIEATSFNNWNPSDYLSKFRYSSRSLCATWDSATGFWAVEGCRNRHLFLCEMEAECIQGRFGQNCSRTCHCYGEQCSVKDGICKYGCQKRWMGSSCDIHKVRATALYYCLKSSTHGNELIIRADQRGIDYQQVLAVDKNGDPVTTCNKSTFTKQGYKLQLTIRRKTSDSEDYRPDCGAQHISNNIFKWRFHFVEFSGTQTIYDISFEMTCDFDKADNLQIGSTTNSEKHKIQTMSLSKTELLLELTVKDPYTGRPLKKAKLNQNAILVLELKTTDEDIAVKKISPYSCVAGTEDGVHAVVFLDHNGCTNEGAQIIFSEGNGTTYSSKPFHTFTFPGYSHVVFSCQFDVCFTNDDRLCDDRCAFLKETSMGGLHNQTSRNFLTGSNHTATRLELV